MEFGTKQLRWVQSVYWFICIILAVKKSGLNEELGACQGHIGIMVLSPNELTWNVHVLSDSNLLSDWFPNYSECQKMSISCLMLKYGYCMVTLIILYDFHWCYQITDWLLILVDLENRWIYRDVYNSKRNEPLLSSVVFWICEFPWYISDAHVMNAQSLIW